MSEGLNTSRAQWSSRMAFLLAAIGGSVGLGNLWRFSAEAGTNGGAAFIAVYLMCVVLVGMPTMMAEFLIGRSGQANSAINSMSDLAKRSSVSTGWSIAAWVGTLSAFLIVSFYCVVAAWVMTYIGRFATGRFNDQTPTEIAAQFDTLIGTPSDVLLPFLIFAALVIWVVSRGVTHGLEMASKILMPLFFVILLALCVFGIVSAWSSGGTTEALKFMFQPDLTKITPSVAVSALGQAFFSIGLGMAIMITYGSYLPDTESIAESAAFVALSDTFVAIIAGLAIFPVVFQYNLDFSAGAGLFFQTLPTALSAMPGGNIIGAAFFLMASFAALTTGVALLEPSVAHATEQLRISRIRASLIMGAAMILTGLICVYSMPFLNFLDKKLTATLLLPLSALLVVLFVGWRLDRTIKRDGLKNSEPKLVGLLVFVLKYVAPFMISVIFIVGVNDQYF